MNNTENRLYDLANEIAAPLGRLTKATWDIIENPFGATEEDVRKLETLKKLMEAAAEVMGV